MRGIIVSNGFVGGRKFSEPAEMMCAAAERHGVTLDRFDNTQLCVPLGDPDSLEKVIGNPEFIIFWDKDVRCARNLELCGHRLFNPSECIRVCDDKSLTHLALLEHGVPSLKTVSCPMTFDNVGYNSTGFLDAVESQLGYPMVVKDCFGSFGQQVRLAGNRTELESMLTDARPRIFQEYVECGATDIRAEVVGGQVLASMERHGPEGDFRSNTAIGGKAVEHTVTAEEEELAVRACEAVGADFAGVDIMYRNGEPVVCEVNSNAHIKNLRDCSDTDVSDGIIDLILRTVRR